MTHEQLQREFQYRVALSLAKELLKSGVITEEDCGLVSTALIGHFQSLLIGLCL